MHVPNDPGRSPRPNRHRRRARSAAIAALLTLLVIPATVFAFNSIGNTWGGIYPASASRTNAGCLLCHGPAGTDTWNPYGWAILQGGGNAAAINAAAGANSDGDPGANSNLAEINANSQPGWTLGNNNTIYDIDGNMTTGQPVPAGITGLIDPPAATPTPTPVPPTPTPVPPTPTPTPTPVPPTPTPTPTPVPPTPTPTPTPVPPTPTPTPTPVPPTPTPTPTPVPPTPTPVTSGHAAGGGLLISGSDRVRFEFEVHSAKNRTAGQLKLKAHHLHFKSRIVTGAAWDEKTVTWSGTGTWNGRTGYSFTAIATDRGHGSLRTGDKRHHQAYLGRDHLEIVIRDGSDRVVLAVAGTVSRGNIVVSQAHGHGHDREHGWDRLRAMK